MTLFSDAFDAVVDSDLGVDATYKAGGVGAGSTVRVLVLERDMSAALQGQALRVDRLRVQVASSLVASPAKGDTLTIGGKVWRIASPPEGDARSVAWLLDCYPP